MDQILKDKTLANISKSQLILIIVNKDSGIDGLAAGLGLHLSLEKLGKKTALMAKAPSVGDAQKLYGVDKIGKFKGSKNLVIVIDNAIETIDRVSHFLDGEKLKLILHVFPQSSGISQNQIAFEEESIKPDILFTIGFNSEDQLKTEIAHVQNIDSTTWLVNISLKDLGQLLAQVNVFNENAASLCEITADFINQLALPVDEDIAYNLYTGISEATSMFSPVLTGPLSLEVAGRLLKFGAGRASLAQYRQNPAQINSLISPQSNPPVSQPSETPKSPTLQAQHSPEETKPVGEETPSVSAQTQTPDPAFSAAPQPLKSDKNWLNPPKIYKGSQPFDGNS